MHISQESEMHTSPIDALSKLDAEGEYDDEVVYSERIIEEHKTKEPEPTRTDVTLIGGAGTLSNGGTGSSLGAAGEKQVMIQTTGKYNPRVEHVAKIKEAKMKGYTGDICQSCGSLTMVRNGTCLKCTTCGDTSGCS